MAKEYFKERKRIDRHVLRHNLKEMTEHGKKWMPEEWNEDIEGLIKHIEYDFNRFYDNESINHQEIKITMPSSSASAQDYDVIVVAADRPGCLQPTI